MINDSILWNTWPRIRIRALNVMQIMTFFVPRNVFYFLNRSYIHIVQIIHIHTLIQ